MHHSLVFSNNYPGNNPILESYQESQSSHSDPNKKYVRRRSFILSSGRNKFTFDSEAKTGSTTSQNRESKVQTRPNLNQTSYHVSNSNLKENNNSSSYVNYNDISMMIPSKEGVQLTTCRSN